MINYKVTSQCISSDYCRGWNDAVSQIKSKTAYWEEVKNNGLGNTGKCTNCNKYIYGFEHMNYCPNCGFKMIGTIDTEKVIRCIACEYFEPSEEENWGWCINNRCKKSKNGFCDEAMHKVN